MIPYYKLPTQWTQDRFFVIIGPEGLVSLDLFKQIKTAYPNHPPKHVPIYDKSDIDTLKTELSDSLFPNPEILFIRLNPKLLSSFPFEIKSQDKIVVVFGLEKPIKVKTNALLIRTYAMKEPHKSRAIQTMAKSLGLQLSPKGIQWLSLSHQNLEYLIPNTLEKIKLTYGQSQISDEALKPLIYNHNQYPAYEIIEHLISNKTSLQLFMSSQRPEDWQAIYWTLLGTWRKLLLCHYDKSQLATHFPWDIQKKQALGVLNHTSESKLRAQLESLLDLEVDIKGLRFEPFIPKLQHWLLSTQLSLSSR